MIKFKTIFILISVLIIFSGCQKNAMNMETNIKNTNNQETTEDKQCIKSKTEYFLYGEIEGGIEITGYEFEMHEANFIEFPVEIEGKSVVSIGKEAFMATNIEKIYIPSSVKKISESAFYLCKQLEQVTLEEGIEVIEKVAFSNCQKLKSINLVSTIKEIQDGAFLFTNSLKYIEIPTNIEIINESVFCCSGLNNVILPKELKEIRFEAFSSCANLEEIYIPSTVSIIDESAFGEIESNITIKCEADSYAEEYANQHGINVEVQ